MEDLRSTLQRSIFSLWSRRWPALAVAWLLCVGGWFAVGVIPNQYEASARIYVDADAVLTPLLQGLALDNTPSSQLEVLQHTLLSRPNLEKVVSKTDLELSIAGPTDLERVVLELAQAVKLTPQTRNLFTIGYRNTSPKLAYDVVQAMLTIFIESKAGSNRVDMRNASEFLERQLLEYEQKLKAAEKKRSDFRLKYIDLLPADGTGTSRLEAARSTLAQLDERLKDAMLRRDLLARQLAATQATLSDGGGGGGGGGNPALAEAQRRLADLRLRFTEQHPDVIAARDRVAALRNDPGPAADSPRPRGRGFSNPVYEQLKLQAFENEAGIASLQRQIGDGRGELTRLEDIARKVPGLLADYTDLTRDYDVLRKNHEELLQRRESMHLASAADTEAQKVKLDVVDPPQVPQIPVAPKLALLDSAVLGLGLAGGVGFALMLLQFDSSFHTTDELRRLELPVAGSISLVADVVPLGRRLLNVGGFAAAVLLLCAVWGGLIYRMIHAGIA